MWERRDKKAGSNKNSTQPSGAVTVMIMMMIITMIMRITMVMIMTMIMMMIMLMIMMMIKIVITMIMMIDDGAAGQEGRQQQELDAAKRCAHALC
jgi:hypothetical protein